MFCTHTHAELVIFADNGHHMGPARPLTFSDPPPHQKVKQLQPSQEEAAVR